MKCYSTEKKKFPILCVCLFIITSGFIFSSSGSRSHGWDTRTLPRILDCFDTQSPGIENPSKSFDHPRHLKSEVLPWAWDVGIQDGSHSFLVAAILECNASKVNDWNGRSRDPDML